MWAGSCCAPAEHSRGSGGEKSDTKPKQDHILVCQTSALLSNPHIELLIIPACFSPSLCLSLSLHWLTPFILPLRPVFGILAGATLCFWLKSSHLLDSPSITFVIQWIQIIYFQDNWIHWLADNNNHIVPRQWSAGKLWFTTWLKNGSRNLTKSPDLV